MNLPVIQIDQTPKHQLHHRELRRQQQEWERHRTEGFVRCHDTVEIDDKRIALRTHAKFYELRSFGATLHWSLNKQEIINAFNATNRSHVEHRIDHMGEERRYVVIPTHLSVWEYNPITSHKLNITPKRMVDHDV